MDQEIEMDRASGGRVKLTLPQPGDFASFYVFSMAFSGIGQFWQLLDRLMAAVGRPLCDFQALRRRASNGNATDRLANSAEKQLLLRRGYGFGVFFDVPKGLQDVFASTSAKLLFLRDPRDMIVARYRHLWQRHLQQQSGVAADCQAGREALDSAACAPPAFAEFLRSPDVEDAMQCYRRFTELRERDPNVRLFRYENALSDWLAIAMDVRAALQLPISPLAAAAIAADVPPVDARLPVQNLPPGRATTAHGMYSQEIAEFEGRIADVLAALGYAPRSGPNYQLTSTPVASHTEGAKKTLIAPELSEILAPDPALQLRLKPNASEQIQVLGRKLIMDVDATGCRPVIGQPAAGAKTLAAYGCSWTYGFGVAAEETFCSLLQGMFPAWRVENHGGVAGYGTAQNLIQLERDLLLNKPEFVTFCWLDDHLRRNGASAVWAQFASNRFSPATSRPPGWLAPRAGLDAIGGLRTRSVRMPRYDLLGIDLSDFAPDPYYLDLVCLRLLERANAIVRAYGGHFFITTLWGQPSAVLAARLAENGIPVVNASVSGTEYTCLPDDGHPNAVAHRIYAERIRDYVQQYTAGQTAGNPVVMFRSLVIPITILSAAGGKSRISCNIRYHYVGNAPDAIARSGQEFQIFDGRPTGLMELTDAYYVPGAMCLYDKYGDRILESCTRRGKDLVEFVNAGPETISLPSDFVTVDEPLVYLSKLYNHWGDFLTEGTSRLWAFFEYPELTKISGFYLSTTPVHRNITDFIRLLGLPIRPGEYPLNGPVRFRKVFVPAASFSNRAEAYSVHRKAFLAVSDLYLRENGSQLSDQPVFLSRSKLRGRRDIQNQVELESALAEKGFLIVHPEQLSVAEQIELFNRYRNFSGCWGSAFHTAVLSRSPGGLTTHLIGHVRPSVNFLMFDAMLGNKANYVASMVPIPGQEQVWPGLHLAIDVEQTLRYFEAVV